MARREVDHEALNWLERDIHANIQVVVWSAETNIFRTILKPAVRYGSRSHANLNVAKLCVSFHTARKIRGPQNHGR